MIQSFALATKETTDEYDCHIDSSDTLRQEILGLLHIDGDQTVLVFGESSLIML